MEKSSKRGKIPQHDWPSIIKRYEAGETLASIARTYDCSPPAISYIVSRTRARDMNGEGARPSPAASAIKERASETPPAESQPPDQAPDAQRKGSAEAEPPAEPRLAKSQPTQLGQEMSGQTEPAMLTKSQSHTGDHLAQGPTAANLKDETLNGFPRASAGQNEGQRRTLHLQLAPNPTGHTEAELHDRPVQHSSGPNSPSIAHSSTDLPQGQPMPTISAPALESAITNSEWPRRNNGPHSTKDGSAFIDRALRERVDGEITAFLAAFDAALAQDTLENRAGLREATDRLLRAGARTRIELERLEARVPLPPREAAGYASPAWRPR